MKRQFKTRVFQKTASALLLIVTSSCVGQNPRSTHEPEFEFPSLKPFVLAKVLDEVGQEIEAFLGDAREEIPEMIRLYQNLSADEVLIWEGRKAKAEKLPPQLDARLSPQYPPRHFTWLGSLPFYMSFLRALWVQGTWTKEEVEIANLVAPYLSLTELGIDVEFVLGEDERNRESMERVGRWFRELTAETEYFASMSLMFSSPPLQGLEIDTGPIEEVQSSIRVSDDISLRLCHLPELEEPFVLQCYVTDELRWSRVVSNAPWTPFKSVELLDSDPVDLEEYGWEVDLNFEVREEVREGGLFLNRSGELLFYCYSVNF